MATYSSLSSLDTSKLAAGIAGHTYDANGGIFSKINGEWQSVTAVFIKINGEWVNATKTLVKVDDAWKTV